MILRSVILLLLLLVIDLYVFSGVKFLTRNLQPVGIKLVWLGYWSVTAICFTIIIWGLFVDWNYWPKAIRTYSFAFIFVTYFSKLFFIFFLFLDDIFRVLRWFSEFIFPTKENIETASEAPSKTSFTRTDFLVRLGALIAAIPFSALIFGMIKGKYEYQVRKVKLHFTALPDAFKGFKIVQISDIHSGSFMDANPLTKAVEMILEVKPDIIFFTGDLVNDKYEELLPYKEILATLSAPHGVYSILGNHDYGDYYQWSSKADKENNLSKLIAAHREMGWELLLDEHRRIEKNGAHISVIGVQNWSARMNFARYGNLNKSLEGINFSPFNILLSHDPSHWQAEVAGKIKEIDLTLSGHTHGFQFGVEIPGFKWSPVQYIYKEWADLYTSGKQHLYVNRGLGFLGYPGRVGILPEITVFELNKS
ncbi:MAG: metallophosphoesterase [Bacteroidetes bacterium]|nr:metallophosphoesterase [Bacteroidota bacterium]